LGVPNGNKLRTSSCRRSARNATCLSTVRRSNNSVCSVDSGKNTSSATADFKRPFHTRESHPERWRRNDSGLRQPPLENARLQTCTAEERGIPHAAKDSSRVRDQESAPVQHRWTLAQETRALTAVQLRYSACLPHTKRGQQNVPNCQDTYKSLFSSVSG
jgi:hypothetical protein